MTSRAVGSSKLDGFSGIALQCQSIHVYSGCTCFEELRTYQETTDYYLLAANCNVSIVAVHQR